MDMHGYDLQAVEFAVEANIRQRSGSPFVQHYGTMELAVAKAQRLIADGEVSEDEVQIVEFVKGTHVLSLAEAKELTGQD